MAIVTRHFRCQSLTPNGAERLNPAYETRLEALIAENKTEAEAETILTNEKVEKTIKPTLQIARFHSGIDGEELKLIVKEGATEIGHLWTVTFT